ncbi:hypothetical protein [Enterococcus camelliae]|uniref:ABC transporter permease n=1 Tax=Enterococcus camelliae TaxID=453959 RepID=A0ABW5THC2_9ENTE
MMKNELTALIWKRTKLTSLAIGGLFLLFGIFWGVAQTNTWQANYKYAHSKEALQQNEQVKKEIAKMEDEINQKYHELGDTQAFWQYINTVTSIDQVVYNKKEKKYELKEMSDYYFNSSINDTLFQANTWIEGKSGETREIVGAQDILNSGYFVIGHGELHQFLGRPFFLFFIIAGFINCFIDYKTNFVVLLFGSKFSRKRIIRTKIIMGTIAITLSATAAILGNLAIVYARIPHQYINISLTYLLAFHGCMLLIGLLLYFIALLAGTVCGQYITGIGSLIGFIFGLSLIVNSATEYLSYLNSGSAGNDNYYVRNLYGLYPSYQAWGIMSLGIVLLIILLYQTTVHLYPKLSLENRNQFILYPKLRWPLTIFASLFSAFAATWVMSYTRANLDDQSYQLIIRDQLISAVTVFLVIFILFVILNHTSKIMDFLYRKLKRA